MNANEQDAGGLLPCPFCGGEPIQYDYADGYGIHCGNVECTIDMFATSRDSDADARAIWNRRNGELCRAAPAGGDVERFSPDCEPCSDFESWVGCMRPDPNGQWVRYAPAGSGEVSDDMVERACVAWMGNKIDDWADLSTQTQKDIRDGMRQALTAALLRKLQQGEDYVMVPRVPTEAMEVAFCEAWFSKKRPIDDPEMADAYAAMIAASQGQEGGNDA